MVSSRFRHVAMTVGAKVLWHMPLSFSAVRLLGSSYALRCVVFHHIAAEGSPFTRGIKVSMAPQAFEAMLQFLTAYYVPVSLQDAITNADDRGLPPRAILVTFDDAYASVAEYAAPLCRRYGVPAVFFINAAFIDNQRLAPDNLICYVASLRGMEAINAATRSVPGYEGLHLRSLAEAFGEFLPSISLAEREVFLDRLRHLAGIDESQLAREAALYLTSDQLRNLASFNFEIGNHTYTHTYCRKLTEEDLRSEIDRNREALEAMSGTKIRSYSQPYGSSRDLTPELMGHLKRSAYEAVFLSESVANPHGASPFKFDRVSTCAASDEARFFEIEALPRLRATRNHMFRKLLRSERA